jgi:CubicO group peptidase (beta-lactamase class C family)
MKHSIFIIVLLLWSASVEAQDWKHKSLIDSFLASKKYPNNAPCIAICIVEKGQIVYEKQFGMANLEQKIPAHAQTIFNIGSVTKQFTAACILLLEEQGKLKRTDISSLL